MANTITVRGKALLRSAPDTAALRFTLRSKSRSYEKMMQQSERDLAAVRKAASEAGFAPEELKTEHYGIDAEYDGRPDKNGNYRRVFTGYVCTQQLRLEMAPDTARLHQVLSALGHCTAEPNFSLQFLLRQTDQVSAEVLRRCAAQAREQAEILAEASGASLGALCAVEYGSSRPEYASETSCNMLMRAAKCDAGGAAAPELTPDDITVEESALFTWELIADAPKARGKKR